jgi:fumarylacetoacetase
MMELTQGGKKPLELPDGERRTFVEDGDEVIERAFCAASGARIGFGEASGRIAPAAG